MNNFNLLIPDKIIKTKRKTISLIIKNDAMFIVRAPLKCDEKEILKFIQQKAEWILRKREDRLSNLPHPLKMQENEQLTILGKTYQLFFKDVKRAKVFENTIILPLEERKDNLIKCLKKIAKDYLTQRVKELSNEFNLKYTSISISSAKTCWGSCGFNNKLHFTYKLILTPKEVVDYVIIHELCHTKIKNHSNIFWQEVKKMCSNYRVYEKWLKQNRGVVDII